MHTSLKKLVSLSWELYFYTRTRKLGDILSACQFPPPLSLPFVFFSTTRIWDECCVHLFYKRHFVIIIVIFCYFCFLCFWCFENSECLGWRQFHCLSFSPSNHSRTEKQKKQKQIERCRQKSFSWTRSRVPIFVRAPRTAEIKNMADGAIAIVL